MLNTCWSPSLELLKHKFRQNIHPSKRTVRIITNPRRREKCRPSFKSPKLMTLPWIYILKTYIYFRSKCDLKRGSNIHFYSPITRVGDNFYTGRAVVHFITTLPIRRISFILTKNVQTWSKVPQFSRHLKLVRNLQWSLKSFTVQTSSCTQFGFVIDRLILGKIGKIWNEWLFQWFKKSYVWMQL